MATKGKSHQATAKRTKLSGNNKLLRRRPFANHFLSKKRAGRKREFAKDHQFNKSERHRVRRLLGI